MEDVETSEPADAPMREATPAPPVKAEKVAEPVRPSVRYLPYASIPKFSAHHPASRKAVVLEAATGSATFPPHMFHPSVKRTADEGYEAYKVARQRLVSPDGLITLDGGTSFFIVSVLLSLANHGIALSDIDKFSALQAAFPDVLRTIGASTTALSQTDALLLDRELAMRLDLTTRASHIMEQVYMFRAVSHSYGDIIKALSPSRT